MLSCQRSSTMFARQTTSPFLHRFRHFKLKPHRPRFRCLLDQIVAPSSSLTSANVIAAAAKAASVHGAVSSAITQVAVTAFAIASGACLSTKVDFLWPKLEEQTGPDSADSDSTDSLTSVLDLIDSTCSLHALDLKFSVTGSVTTLHDLGRVCLNNLIRCLCQ